LRRIDEAAGGDDEKRAGKLRIHRSHVRANLEFLSNLPG
jgi:hypothetical protein